MGIHLSERRKIQAAVLVAALGYFVDVFDMQLFSVVRIASLKSIGVSDSEVLDTGVMLLNCQLCGMLIGGILWGILGDRRGRIQVLFGSILLYSVANLLNAFVYSVESYALLRFIAGIGLAGEIGAGITLVSELMSKENRGLGTTVVAAVGVSGALLAAIVGEIFHWRTTFLIGGVMGLLLLLLRVSVHESGMFDSLKQQAHIERGTLGLLFRSPERLRRFLNCILVGLPIWFGVGILVPFAPELGRSLGVLDPIKVSIALAWFTVGATSGDLASGLVSQLLKSRKKAIGLFLLLTILFSYAMLFSKQTSATQLYALYLPIGFFIGYWAVFLTTAAEQFGTNLRATVTTSVPNLVRGAAVLMTMLFASLKGEFGVVGSAQCVGALIFGLAILGLWSMRETFGIDLRFVENEDGVAPLSELVQDAPNAVGNLK